jgi:hypothetical protein
LLFQVSGYDVVEDGTVTADSDRPGSIWHRRLKFSHVHGDADRAT